MLSEQGLRPNATNSTTTRATAVAQERCSFLCNNGDRNAYKVSDGL